MQLYSIPCFNKLWSFIWPLFLCNKVRSFRMRTLVTPLALFASNIVRVFTRPIKTSKVTTQIATICGGHNLFKKSAFLFCPCWWQQPQQIRKCRALGSDKLQTFAQKVHCPHPHSNCNQYKNKQGCLPCRESCVTVALITPARRQGRVFKSSYFIF